MRRATTLFDEIVVGIAASQTKRPFFTLEERVSLAREVLKPYRNVRVEGFRGLLMDFVRGQKAQVDERVARGGSSPARTRTRPQWKRWLRVEQWAALTGDLEPS